MLPPDLRLDSTSAQPLHVQLAERLTAYIQAGDWPPGMQLPSERELMRLAQISRATVRQTLTALTHGGLIEKTHGRGTFVRQPRYETPLDRVYSFSEQLRALGVTLHDTLLERRLIAADVALAAKLGTAAGEPVIHIQRLRQVGGTPMMVSSAYIPQRRCPALLDAPLGVSLYRLLTTTYGIALVRAVDLLEAVEADRKLAHRLHIRPHAPLMYVERIAWTTGDVVLHIGQTHIRADMCRFRSDLNAAASTLEFKLPEL